MLQAKKISWWRSHYAITADGQLVTSWEQSAWRSRGSFELDGTRYEVRGNLWGNRYELVTGATAAGDAAGNVTPGDVTPGDVAVVASANRVGRKRWTVEAQGQTYEFRRASIWRYEEELHCDGRPVGSVRRSSWWRSDVHADLPGLPRPVQIFVLVVVLMKWEQQDSAAASG